MDNDPEAKAKKCNVLKWLSHSPDLNPNDPTCVGLQMLIDLTYRPE